MISYILKLNGFLMMFFKTLILFLSFILIFSSFIIAKDEDKTQFFDITFQKKPTVVFVTGDDEYRSRENMLPYAEKLRKDYNFNVIYLKDTEVGGHRRKHDNELEGAEKIINADLMVLFVRFRQWGPKTMKHFMAHFEKGKPAIGIRTTTHAFWKNKTFSPIYFGGHYKNHPHRQLVCQVDPQYADHPIARGVTLKFAENEGPYLTSPLTEGATPIVLGYGIKKRRDPKNIIAEDHFDSPTTPIVWSYDHKGARRAMITLFSHRVNSQNMDYSKNLFYNSVFWSLGYEVPKDGVLAKGKNFKMIKEKKQYKRKKVQYPSIPNYTLDKGWQSLFDGKSLDLWKHYDYLSVGPILEVLDRRATTKAPIDMSKSPARWKIEDSSVVARVGYGDIVTKKTYRNFKLRFNFLVPQEPDWVKNEWRGNSGVFIHGSYEICILDSHGQQASKRTNGALYRQVAPKTEASLKAGEWQSMEITVKDKVLTVYLNGKLIHDKVKLNDRTLNGFPTKKGEGPIRLQGECSAVRFANLAIKVL